jgi:hypothetical protein
MGTVTDRALLRSGMVGGHDLTLLQRPPRQAFMAAGAKLSRVGRDDHLQISGVNRAGRGAHERVADIALTGGTVADLAFDDFAEVGAVVDSFGPLRELLGVAGRAIGHALVFRFVRGDIRDRVAPVMTIFVK